MRQQDQAPAVTRIIGWIGEILPGASEATGYHKIFMIRWYEVFGKDIQHHKMAVNMWNETARDFKSDDYQEGEHIELYPKLKAHREEGVYLELTNIRYITRLKKKISNTIAHIFGDYIPQGHGIQEYCEMWADEYGYCLGCGGQGVFKSVHHIIRRSRLVGNPNRDDWRNLVMLCQECHTAYDKFEREDAVKKLIEERGLKELFNLGG